MAPELDLLGCAAPACAVQLPQAEPLVGLVGAGAVRLVQTIAAEWCAPFAWPLSWIAAWGDHGQRVVHAWHDLRLFRPLPQVCLLSAEVVAQRPTRAGALTVIRYDGSDDDGPLWTSFAGALWRDVHTVARGEAAQPSLAGCGGSGVAVEVSGDFALRYSRASGIWNPIHTDLPAAQRAGLPAPILHGSATLALALGTLSESTDAYRVQARFLAPVIPPDTLDVAIHDHDGEVRRSDGTVVLRLRTFPLSAKESS